MMVGAAAVAVLATATACSDSGTEQTEPSPSTAPSTAAPSSAAPAAVHNHADVKFVHHMIPHHQQAIEMSDIILAKSDIDPRVSDLATQIKAAQDPEIQQMQDWLTQWGMPTMAMTPGMGMPGMEMPDMSGPPPTPTHSDAPGPGTMPSGSMMPGMDGMMGMMSPADMDALNDAQGVAASELFLTQMITHHEGAITMAQKEIKKGQFSPAIALAQSIITSQQEEIDTMNQLLDALR
ncbi:MAG: DUF305 domain-containing protein [Actinomycetia bacterium]|nr:DUF305 domain-containing protein [Actinomycetes bacterium]